MTAGFASAIGDLPPGSVVAVGLFRVRQGQRHTGILYEPPDGDRAFLHLRWHLIVENRVPPPSSGTWVEVLDLDPLRLPAVSLWCELVANEVAKQAIPYGFRPPNDCFDLETGRWLLGQDGSGLTCATFVLAVLRCAGIELVDAATWPDRDSDEEWKLFVIEEVREQDPSRAAYLESEVDGFRFRPEEVAGAAAVSELPASFAEASAHAVALLQHVIGV